ncbi:unnamed protein product [Amoebophrya sp. A120]|nr:unnamed protein product [Amoebophrya sp. A120]|eukprot:GSA120T00000475001.1
MMQAQPLYIQAGCKLGDQGIGASALSFANLQMQSDKYLCVKDAEKGQVVVFDIQNNYAKDTKPMKADTALMNPSKNWIALKGKSDQGGDFVQVYNLDTKAKLGVWNCPEDLVLMSWLNDDVLGLVLSRTTYHWKVEGSAEAEKIMDRTDKLAEPATQVVSYSMDPNGAWCLLCGIASDDKKTIDGYMQLYSIERKQQQLIQGHGGAFGKTLVDDSNVPATLVTFAKRDKGSFATTLQINEVGQDFNTAGRKKHMVQKEIPMPPESPNDFALSMHISEKLGVIYMLMKSGNLFMFDVATGEMLYRNPVSKQPILKACNAPKTGGILFINKDGHVCSAGASEQGLVPYIFTSAIPNKQEIGINLARRFGFAGAEEILNTAFQRDFAMQNYKEAATTVAKAKALRTSETIEKFRNAPQPAGQPLPLLTYFSTLLDKAGKLNKYESVQLCQLVVQQGRHDLIEKWLNADQLDCSEELGDVIKQLPALSQHALKVYYKGEAHQKVINSFMEMGQVDKIIEYAKKANAKADYSGLMRNLVAVNPQQAVEFAKSLMNNVPPLTDIRQIIDTFMSQNRLQETTSVLIDYLKENKPEHAALQTELFRMNLLQAPQAAELIFQLDTFTHYDKQVVAQLCEKAGLWNRALQDYTDISDVRRVLAYAPTMNAEFLVNYCTKLPPQTCLEVMGDLMKNRHQNLNVVVQVAIKCHQQIGAEKLIEMFESFSSFEGVFYFVGAISSQMGEGHPEVIFKYIQAASRLGNVQEVERVLKENPKSYDPVKVKDFLKGEKLPDPRPLIYVCDLHGFIEELATYLYNNQLLKYIEVYVTKVNPLNTPKFVGTLIDLDCSEDFIKQLLQAVRSACPVEPLVTECEKRNRLRLLQPWLEARVSEGNQEGPLHNALAMICIETGRDPETFLKNNHFYDSKVVGKFCEERDPHLAYTCYKRAFGQCDEELVAVTNKNGLFKLQAKYLVERKSPELWATVLGEEANQEFRRKTIDQTISSALPECTNPDEVSVTVKAFIAAELHSELIELLEKIVLHRSEFANARNLQNLLILTAIRADPTRVMDYINRLTSYNGPEIAKVALGPEYKLYEEAFVIYKKGEMHPEAMDVLLLNIDSIERAAEYAARVNEPVVWSKLGKAYLESGAVAEAIDSYIKANDASDYMEVISVAERQNKFEELVTFLKMARKSQKDQHLDSELVYSYAKIDNLADLEEFVSGTNTANCQMIGDRLYDEGNYKAAKLLFQSIGNNAKLASCYVKLEEYNAAVEAAKKANNPKVWKEVSVACVAAQEFRCASIAGMSIIVHPDHLEELIAQYEKHGYFEELIQLLDQGLSAERAHVGMYTELAILYSKYKPERLMDFIKMNTQKCNIPKVIRACERHCHWEEAVHLYTHYDEYDSAANCMMQHSPVAFSHDQFLFVMQKVANTELLYRAISFYIEEQPLLLDALLKTIESKVDHARVVQQMRDMGHLPLILPYLKQVQVHNIQAVNEALNELYLEAEDHSNLRKSIEEYENIDQLSLAGKLEKHELLEMRRIASLVYKKNKRYGKAIELSKNDKIFQDAMETARDSGSSDLALELLQYFIQEQDKECFTACLFTCYALLKPDVVMELAWRNNMMNSAMPYLIQSVKQYTARIDGLDKKVEKEEKEKEQQKSANNDYVADYGMGPAGMMPGFGHLAIGNAPFQPAANGMMGMGGPPMGGPGSMGGF